MDITLAELKIIADEQGFNIAVLEKDYLVTYLLYLIRNVEGMYFKGGTAINKIFLKHQRLSEDLDFSLTRSVADVESDIKNILSGTLFNKITHDKRVDKFTRLVIHYKLFHEAGTIFIDLNERAKLLLKPEKIKIPHFYKEFIHEFEVFCLNKDELIAEKVMAVCQRYKPRDYFDLYYIIKRKIPINIPLVRKKFWLKDMHFSVLAIFENTNKIFNQWNDDLFALTKEKLPFKEVMKTLSDYFKQKEEKEKIKSERSK